MIRRSLGYFLNRGLIEIKPTVSLNFYFLILISLQPIDVSLKYFYFNLLNFQNLKFFILGYQDIRINQQIKLDMFL